MSAAIASLINTEGDALGPVLASCAFGISISYFGLNARKTLQATAFSVLGVVCKFGTVLINTLLWEHHASPLGIFWLCVCIAGGILYQQAMKGAAITKHEAPKPSKQEYSEVANDDPEA